MLLPQPAGCGSVPSSTRERQREGPSADPAQRCPVGLVEVQTQFPVGNGDCALLHQWPLAGHKPQPMSQALYFVYANLEASGLQVRGANNRSIELHQNVI